MDFSFTLRPAAAEELRARLPRRALQARRRCAARGTTRAARATRCGRRWRSSAGSACRCPRSTAAAGSAWWRRAIAARGDRPRRLSRPRTGRPCSPPPRSPRPAREAQKKRWLPRHRHRATRARPSRSSTPTSTGAPTRSPPAAEKAAGGWHAHRRQAVRAVGARGRRHAGARRARPRADALPRRALVRAGVTLSPVQGMDSGHALGARDARRRAASRRRPARRARRRRAAARQRLLRRGAVGAAAEMLGAARRCLDMAVGYAKVREQFGQPIGSFQAIRHKCAEMLLEVENSHAAVYYAAWALDAGAEDAVAGRLRRQGLRRRRVPQGLRRGDPGARRHRLHLGVRPAPLLQARQGAGGACTATPTTTAS